MAKSEVQTDECIAVVGLGRFGMLWATLLAQHATAGGYRVIAYNRTPKVVTNPTIEVVGLPQLKQATLIFVCTAISALSEVLAAIRLYVRDGAIVCDTCSVKEYPQRQMRALLPRHCALLGTHPMFGPDSLTTSDQLPIVFCPIRISAAALQRCTDLFSLWQLHAIQMTAHQHDKMSAYSQGFTHLVGRIAQDLRLSATDMATLGYKKLLQVMEQTCRDSWELFIDLQRYNRHTRQMLAQVSASVTDIRKKIERKARTASSAR